MEQGRRRLPFSMVTLVFGAISVPLAFARHLVSLAVVLGLFGLLLGLWGRLLAFWRPGAYRPASVRRAGWGLVLAAIGTVASVVMWVLWANGVLTKAP